MIYLAHSANDHGQTHAAKKHLLDTARLAEVFAENAAWSSEAGLAGLLHDLGKYGDLFQARLRGEASGLDHWSIGVLAALEQHAVAAALAIQGHHTGLQSYDTLKNSTITKLIDRHPFKLKLTDTDITRLKARFSADGLIVNKPEYLAITQHSLCKQIAAMLDVRLLFSCLTDADFMDTEAHFEGDKQGKRYRDPGPKLDAAQAITRLNNYMVRIETQ